MPHKLEALNVRDRMNIGDWVLCDGEPYQWKADDFNRSSKGMEGIKAMPLTLEFLESVGFEVTSTKATLKISDKDIIEIWVVAPCFYMKMNITHPYPFECNMYLFTVSQLQHTLRNAQLFDII